VVPRPIAWVMSQSAAGVVNLAPFSFFNAVAGSPPYIVLSIGVREDGSPKDSARNIEARGEFAVSLVTEELMGAMNISAAEFPPDESELPVAQLHTVPSVRIGVPHLGESPVSLECRLAKSVPLGANTLYIGEVLMFHVEDRLVGPRLHINGFAPVGRLGAPSLYCRTTDRFNLPRLRYEEALQAAKPGAAGPVG
jgi:flavin reductase (DIM6/NTAB) family NADH-FMN oxidoreductase RutF